MSYNCDPNFYKPGEYYSPIQGLSASTDRCLYHKRIAEYSIEHVKSFFAKYKDTPKIYQLSLVEGHDMSGGTVRYID